MVPGKKIFHQNQPSGSWKEDFSSVLTIYGHGSHLGHVTSIMLMNFISLSLQAYIQNLAENGPVVTDKTRNDLDLQYSHISINSISFRTQAAIVSEISTVFPFSYRKA